MKGYRFITNDDTSEFCHRVTEAIFNANAAVDTLTNQLLTQTK